MSQPTSPSPPASNPDPVNTSSNSGANESAFVESLLKNDTNIDHTPSISNEESVAPIKADMSESVAGVENVIESVLPPPTAPATAAVDTANDSAMNPSTDQVETTSVALTQQQEPTASQSLAVTEKIAAASLEAELEFTSSAPTPAVAAAVEEEKEQPAVDQPNSPSFSASDSASESVSRSASSLSHSSRSASFAGHPISPSISADSSSQSEMEEDQSVHRSDSASSSDTSAGEEESNLQLPSQASSVLSQPVIRASARTTSIVASQQLNRTSSNMPEEEQTSSQIAPAPQSAAFNDDEVDLPATQPQPSQHDETSARTPLFGPSLRVDATFNRTFSGRSFAPDAPFMPVKPLQLIKEQSVEEAAAEAEDAIQPAAADSSMVEQQELPVQQLPQANEIQDAEMNLPQETDAAPSTDTMEDVSVAPVDPFTSSSVSRSASMAEIQLHDRLVSREPSRAASNFNPFETQEQPQFMIEPDQSVTAVEEDKEPTAEIVPLLANRAPSNSIAPVDALAASSKQVDDTVDNSAQESVSIHVDNRLARVESVAMEFTQTVSAPIQVMQHSTSVSESMAEAMADIAEDDVNVQDADVRDEQLQSQAVESVVESTSELASELKVGSSEQSVVAIAMPEIQDEKPSAEQASAEEKPTTAEQVMEESAVEAAPIVADEVVNAEVANVTESVSAETTDEPQQVCEAEVSNEEISSSTIIDEAQPSESNASAPAACDTLITSTCSESQSLAPTQVSSSQKCEESVALTSLSQQPAAPQELDQPSSTTMEVDAAEAAIEPVTVTEVVIVDSAVEAPMEVSDATVTTAIDGPAIVEYIEAPTATVETTQIVIEQPAQSAAEVQLSATPIEESSITVQTPANTASADIPVADVIPAVENSQADATAESVSIPEMSVMATSDMPVMESQSEAAAVETTANEAVVEATEQVIASDAAVVNSEATMETQAEEVVVSVVEAASVEPVRPSEDVVDPESTPSNKEVELVAELESLRVQFEEQSNQLKAVQSEVQSARESESTLRSEWSTKQAHFESLIAEFDANQLAASNSFQSQLHTAQAETTRLSAAQQQLTQQLASTQERLTASEASSTQFESEVKSLSNQLATAQDESVKLQSDVGSLMAALESKNAACEAHSKELRENAVELQQLRLQATPTQHLIEARDLEIKTKVSELNDKAESIKRLKSRIDELEEEAKTAQLESKKLQKKNATLESINEELQEQVKSLPSVESQLSSAHSRIQSYETEMNQLRDSLKAESTKTEAAEIRSSADRVAAMEFEDQAKSLSQRLLNSEKEINQSESKISELNTTNTELMSKVALLEEKEKAHHASSTAIKNAIETYRAQKSQLMKENKQFTEQVAQLQAQLAKAPNHKVQIDEMTKLQAELQEKHDALEKECASLRKQVSDLSSVKKEMEFENTGLRKSEKEQRRKIEENEEKLEEMKEKLEAAEKKLSEPKRSSAAIAIPESNSPPVESIQNTASDATSSKTSSRRRLQLELTVSEVPDCAAAIASKEENTVTIPDEPTAQEPAAAVAPKKERKEESKESKEQPSVSEADNGTSGKKVLRVRGKTNAEKEKDAALQAKADKEREDKEFAAALAASLAESAPAATSTAAAVEATSEVEPTAVSTRSSSHGSSASESKKSTSRKKQSVKDSIASMEVEQTTVVVAAASSELAEATTESSKTKPSRKRKSGTDDAEKAKAKEDLVQVEEKAAEVAPPASPKLSAKDAFRLKQSKGKTSATSTPAAEKKEDVMDTTIEEQPTDVHASVASLATPSTKKRTSKSPTIPHAAEEKEKETEQKEQKEQQQPVEEHKTTSDESDSADKDGGSARKKRRTSRAPAVGSSRNGDMESDVKLSSIQKPVIMFSGFKPGTINNLEQLATLTEGAKNLGATIAAADKCDWNQITHCVAPKGSTTEKALGACLMHKFVCEPEWLLYSIAAGQFLDESATQSNSYACEPFKGKTYSILTADFERKPERIGLATRLVQMGEGTILPFADEEDSLQLLDAILCEPKSNHKSLSALALSKLLPFEKFMCLIPTYQSKPDSSNSSNASTTGSERKPKRKASEEESKEASKEAPASASSKRTASNSSVKEVTLDKENVSMSANNIQSSIADLTPASKGGEKKKQRKAGSVVSEPTNTNMDAEESDKDKKKKNKRSTKNEDDSEEMSASQPKPTTRQARNLRV